MLLSQMLHSHLPLKALSEKGRAVNIGMKFHADPLGITTFSRLDCTSAAMRDVTDQLNEGTGVSGG